MTRLVCKDICQIKQTIKAYDQLFLTQTGGTMAEIAKKAVGLSKEVKDVKAATVTVTSGLGVISGFAGMVAEILRHCGVEAAEMNTPDVGGIQEAFMKDMDIIFMADDDIFSAFGTGIKVQSDNGYATGIGYAAALIEAMKNRGISVKREKILVLGAGPVGDAAVSYFIKEGAVPCIFDLNLEKARALCKQHKGAVLLEQLQDYKTYPFILDASTAKEIINKEDVTKNTIISAPGMPCAASASAAEIVTVIHNPLELGVITMYYDCLKQLEAR